MDYKKKYIIKKNIFVFDVVVVYMFYFFVCVVYILFIKKV